MKALVYLGPERLDYREAADPVAGAGELLVRVDSVGICGSDMHAFLGHDERRPAPLILGHEAAGRVVGGVRDGERVTINPLVTCGACPACLAGRDNLCADRQILSMPPREGAFGEYVAIPARNIVRVPDTVPLEKAALAEPIACGWHAVRLAMAARQGEARDDGLGLRALVLGGGAIGLGAALCLRARGTEDITLVEPNAERRAYLSARCGLSVLDAPALENEADFDIVIDGVGYEATRRAASRHVRPGGVIMHIGLGSAEGGLDLRRMTLQEVAFIGTYTYTAQDFRDTAAAIFDGRLGPLDWTETRDLSEGAGAFGDIRQGKVAAPKIILKPA